MNPSNLKHGISLGNGIVSVMMTFGFTRAWFYNICTINPSLHLNTLHSPSLTNFSILIHFKATASSRAAMRVKAGS